MIVFEIFTWTDVLAGYALLMFLCVVFLGVMALIGAIQGTVAALRDYMAYRRYERKRLDRVR